MNQESDYDVPELIGQLAGKLRGELQRREIAEPKLIGIHTGGVWVAERLRHAIGIEAPLGTLDITFYRDDFSRIGMHPQVKPSNLPFEVDDQHLVLVDDVLQTGRTIRAALNEIFDYGRPASVLLVVLVDRSGRELPIQADLSALRIELGPHEHIKLTGPETLALVHTTHEQ